MSADLKTVRRVSRERDLEHRKLTGFRRAQRWGGKSDNRSRRREFRTERRTYC